MRSAARIALAIVVVMTLGGLLPRPLGRLITSDAFAQIPLPTPSVTLPDPDPDPTETPTPTPTPTPTEPDDGDDGGGGGGGGGGDGSSGGGSGGGGDQGTGGTKGAGGSEEGGYGKVGRPTDEYLRVPGSYSTDRLVAVATRLRSLGWSSDEIVAKVFPPFIIGGSANWIDSWGARRYGPGAAVRTHVGQDIFCRYGDPVLATESGTISYGNGGLGGVVARLHRPDGSYWYYAHLSDVNDDQFPSGAQVRAGDVIGYCGNTGNAITTPPHVHFGWYQANGDAKNPMRQLVKWLRAAEENSGMVASKAHGRRIARIDALTAARRFGDAFAPDLSELRIAGESLWSSGSTPASGTFALAEAALQAALSDTGFGDVGGDFAVPSRGSREANGFAPFDGADELSSWLRRGRNLSAADVAGD